MGFQKEVRPLVSVVICHHKGDLIQEAVYSVLTQKKVRVEVIIITSSKELRLPLVHPDVRVFHTHLQYPAAKRNLGASIAKSEFIAFFDDDVSLEEDSIFEMYRVINTANLGMVYGKLLKGDEPDRLDEAGGYLTWTGFIWSLAENNNCNVGYDEFKYIFSGKSAACMIRKTVFDRVGGFDSDFGILGEESDLSWRVWLFGWKIGFVPSSLTLHFFNTDKKPVKDYYTSYRVHFMGCRNYCTMLIKNLEWRNLWIVPIHMTLWLISGISLMMTMKFQEGSNILKALGSVILTLPKIWKKRQKIQSQRFLSDDQLKGLIFKNPPLTYFIERFKRYVRIGLHG